MRPTLSLLVFVLVGVGCDGSTAPLEPPPPVSAVIGVAGGSLATVDRSVELVVPPGALAEDVTLEVTPVDDPAAAALSPASLVYQFGPAGLRFDQPIEVRIAYAGSATSMLWTNEGGAYEPIGGSGDGSIWTAQVQHFSRGFVGTPPPSTCAGGAVFLDAPTGYRTVEAWYGGGTGAADELRVGYAGGATPTDRWGWCTALEPDYATHAPGVGPEGLTLLGKTFTGQESLFTLDSRVALVSPVIDPAGCSDLALVLQHEYVQFHETTSPVSSLALVAVPDEVTCGDLFFSGMTGIPIWDNDEDGVLDALDAILERPLDAAIAALGPFRLVFVVSPARSDQPCWSTAGTYCTNSRWEIREVEIQARD